MFTFPLRRLKMSWWLVFILVVSMLYLFLGSIVCSGPTQATEPWTKVGEFTDSDWYLDTAYCMVNFNDHLFAGTNTQIYTYDSNSWIEVAAYSGYPTFSLAVWNDSLYAGTGATVFHYDGGSSWTAISDPGFGKSGYLFAPRLEVYNNELYAIVSADGGPFEVYKYSGSGTTWTRVDTGAWDSSNEDASCAISFDGYLWIGTQNKAGAEVWQYTGSSWTQVNTDGFGQGSAIDSIFNFAVYNNGLYCSVGHDQMFGRRNWTAGVFKYNGGTSWSLVEPNVFEDSNIYYVSALATYDSKLFASTSNWGSVGGNGCEIWSYNGSGWTLESTPGFGDPANLEGRSMIVYDNRLYVGTMDGWGSGAQVWKGTGMPPPTYPSTFYFAEGYTGENFQEYLCLGNPNAQEATAEVTYMFSGGGTQEANYSVPANSRTTVDVNSAVGAGKEVSIQVRSQTANLVAERPMYFNYQGKWTGGSDAVGAVSPAKKWYFAEGTTRPEFEEWLTVQNPGSTKAYLAFHYMVEGQGEVVSTGVVEPNSRATFKASDQVGLDKDISLMLESDQNVVAERPMYFNYQGLASNNWTGGHDVVGALSPVKEWYLAEGTTRDGFEEWLCLQNPNSEAITVNASYLLGPGQGGPVDKSYTVPAQQRLTVSVNKELGPDKDVSVKLTSTSDFIAERPMYFLYHGAWDGGHDVLGTNAPAQTWFFAEGYTGPNFEEWLCLQNPGTTPADVTITYYPESGSPITKAWTVGANSRQTVNVNADAGANLSISAKVESKQPIIVERPMYFNFNSWTGGHDVVGFVPQ